MGVQIRMHTDHPAGAVIRPTGKKGRMVVPLIPPGPVEGRTSMFLTKNATTILKLNKGYLKPAPWWLRWYCSHVVDHQDYK